MLLKLRGGLDSFFVTILLGLLIGAFAIWGIGPNMLSSVNQNIATVGDTEVSTNRYYSQVQNRAQQLQAQFGGQFTTPDIIRMMQLDEQILQQMIAAAAVTEHMSELGLRAGNDLIREELKKYEGFALPDGTISKEMIRQALSSNGISEAEFMDETRRSITLQHLLESFAADDTASRDFAEQLYVWQAERRRASMINIQASDITVADPTEQEIQDYYDLNKSAYMSPERRSYTYLMITPALFSDRVEVQEEDIISLYDSRSDEYIKTEKRGLLLASFAEKAAADAFITAVSSGADFAEAAASVTDFTEEEIKLGDYTRATIESDFDADTAAAVFTVAENGITAPLKAFNGWNVFKVNSITAGSEKTLEDVRSTLIADYKSEEAINLMYDFLPDLEEALADDPALPAIAEKLSLELASVTSVDSRGVTAVGLPAVTQQNEARILSDAFQKEVGIEPELTDIDPTDSEKGVYLIQVNNITESAEQELETVKVNVLDAWKAEKKQAKAGELAETARERLQNGEDAEAVGTEIGGTSFAAKNVARTGDENSNLSANIRNLIFDLAKGSTGSERAADGNGYVVVRVEDVIPGDPSKDQKAIDTSLTTLNSSFKDEIYAQYESYLRQKYRPVVNRAMQKQLFADTANQ